MKATLLTLALPMLLGAHEIPSDVTIQAFAHPAGNTLQLILRVPLAAIRDTDFPAVDGGYLDLSRVEPLLRDGAGVWLTNSVDILEENTTLPRPRLIAARVSLPSDRSFTSWESARAHTTGSPLPAGTRIYWNQAMLDVLYQLPIRSDRARFSVDPRFGRLGLRTLTVLRFAAPDGAVRAFEFRGDPGLVHLDPRWSQAALRFVRLGFLHILDGTDHLLFLLCLVIPFRKFRALIPVVTAFTVAHSITLLASAYNFAPDALWFPPLIETLIAASIVYMALENIVGGTTVERRWVMAFGFGLVHGFGFSFALRQTMQFAGSHLLTSLLSFNVGVELGQLLVLALMIPALELLFRHVVAERMGTIILSALVAHTGWHWMLDRWDRLRQFHFQWPEPSAAFWLSVVRWAIAALVLVVAVWAVSTFAARRKADRLFGLKRTALR